MAEPVVPEYGGACISNVVPALLDRANGLPGWFPGEVAHAPQVVLLVLDGLGWEQLNVRRHLAPALSSLHGGPITCAVPSTTATCLTTLTTGAPPARHGVVGYRMHVGQGSVLNVLRWRTANGDATNVVPPESVATVEPFLGTRPPVITRSEFVNGGFSRAHLRGGRFFGWRVASTIVAHVDALLAAGERFVYCYYDGIDKVAHEYGLGPFYEAELRSADRLVGDLLAVLPPGAALVVTSDHGQVDVGANIVPLAADVMDRTWLLSGEGRFRWLHARPGATRALADAARECHGDRAWVLTIDEIVGRGWFGGVPDRPSLTRLGDVAVVAADGVAFLDPADLGENTLVSRHGSLTSAEMLVPLLAGGTDLG